jgi:S1-C subfamily serine protease
MAHKNVEAIAAQAGASIVGLGDGARGGSGVIVEPGRVLTLARNLRGEEVTVTFAGGRSERGRLAGTDRDRGVALLEVPTGDAPAASWSEQAAPPIGAPVFALADPAGRGLRVTAGAVASAPQSLRGPRGRTLEGLIEHTAPLPRGSGGGPLLDAEGRLLGLNAVRTAYGLILALPTVALQGRLGELATDEAASQRRLGVAIVPPRVARRLRRAVGLPERDGVLVRAVQQDSAAARAGVERGDLIISLSGQEVDSIDALFAALDQTPLGAAAALGIVRGAEERELEVVLGAS